MRSKFRGLLLTPQEAVLICNELHSCCYREQIIAITLRIVVEGRSVGNDIVCCCYTGLYVERCMLTIDVSELKATRETIIVFAEQIFRVICRFNHTTILPADYRIDIKTIVLATRKDPVRLISLT